MKSIEIIIDMFKSLDIFTFICDANKNIIWKNQYAKDSQLDLVIGSHVSDFLKGNEAALKLCDNALTAQNTQRVEVTLYGGFFILYTRAVTLENGENFSWWCLQKKEKMFSEIYQDHQDAGILGMNYRESIFQIYNALPPIAHKMQQYDLYQEIEYLNIVAQATQSILKSTININEYFKFNSGENPMKPRYLFLKKLLHDLVYQISLIIPNDEHRIVFDETCSDVMVYFDEEKLILALLNVLINAIQFSVANTEITITLSKSHEKAVILVKDIGDGISPERLKQVTEAFYSYNPATKTRCGDGLGLYVAQKIIQAHKGSIMITSVENEGTTVSIQIPQAVPSLEKQTVLRSSVMTNLINNRMSMLYAFLGPCCQINMFD